MRKYQYGPGTYIRWPCLFRLEVLGWRHIRIVSDHATPANAEPASVDGRMAAVADMGVVSVQQSDGFLLNVLFAARSRRVFANRLLADCRSRPRSRECRRECAGGALFRARNFMGTSDVVHVLRTKVSKPWGWAFRRLCIIGRNNP